MDWTVVLLKTPEKGFLLRQKDFVKMLEEGSFYQGGKVLPQIEIHEKDIAIRFEFRDLETFLGMVNL